MSSTDQSKGRAIVITRSTATGSLLPSRQQANGNEEKFKLVLKAYEVLSIQPSALFIIWSLDKDGSQTKSTAVPHPSPGRPNPSAQVPIASALQKGKARTGKWSLWRELRKMLLRILYDVRRNTPGTLSFFARDF